MQARSERLKIIRRLAVLLAALSLLMLLVSAYIRLGGAGLGCSDWPDCYGRLLAGGAHPHAGAVRILHRGIASLALLLGFLLAWRCLRPSPIQPAARQAMLLLALMILLTFIGIFSADPQRAWASLGNILGGVALVALSWRLVLSTAPEVGMPALSAAPRAAGLLHAGLAALLVTIALGALIGARYAALSCTSVPACDGVWWPPAQGWVVLDPFAAVAAPAAPGDAGGVALHLLHRAAALAALLLLGLGGLLALAPAATRKIAALLLVLLGIEFALGSLTVLSGFSLGLAIGHSVGAALLLALGIQLLGRLRHGHG